MIISVCGSQGQGKSTTLEALEKKGFSIVKNKTARSILSDWNITLEQVYSDKDLCVKFHELIINRHSSMCEQYKSSNEIFFIERSYADIFSYALAILGPFNSYSKWLDDFYEQCKEKQAEFSGIVYLTGREYVPESDGVRSTNLHFGRVIDSSIERYLKEFSHRNIVFTVQEVQLQSRVRRIEDICKLYFE